MKPDFMDRAAKIIEEIDNRSRTNVVDTEVIEAMLKDALNEYYDAGYEAAYDELQEYYDVGYSEGHSDGYYEGHSEGHSDGYYEGYSEGYLAFNRSTS